MGCVPIGFAWPLRLVIGLLAVAVPAINVIPVASAQGPTPPWKILVLLYEHTDFSFFDGALSRRVVADLTLEETVFAASEAAAFVGRDIPALASHQMRPSLEVRYPGTITDLEPFCGWWPAPSRIATELDPAFDSVIVMWDSTGTDVNSGQPYNLQNCGGLTLPSGTGQTFRYTAVGRIPTEPIPEHAQARVGTLDTLFLRGDRYRADTVGGQPPAGRFRPLRDGRGLRAGGRDSRRADSPLDLQQPVRLHTRLLLGDDRYRDRSRLLPRNHARGLGEWRARHEGQGQSVIARRRRCANADSLAPRLGDTKGTYQNRAWTAARVEEKHDLGVLPREVSCR